MRELGTCKCWVRVAARPAIGTFGKNTYIALLPDLPASVDCCGKRNAECRILGFIWFYNVLHIISSEGSVGFEFNLVNGDQNTLSGWEQGAGNATGSWWLGRALDSARGSQRSISIFWCSSVMFRMQLYMDSNVALICTYTVWVCLKIRYPKNLIVDHKFPHSHFCYRVCTPFQRSPHILHRFYQIHT